MSSVLRPLTLGEILDQTAQLYRRNFALFAGIAVLPNAVSFAVYIAIFLIAGVPLFTANAANPPDAAFGALFVILMLIALPFLLVPMVFSQAGLTRAAVNTFRGERMKVREALTSVKPRFWRYLGLMLLQGLIVFGVPCTCAGVIGGLLAVLTRVGGATSVLTGFLAFVLILAAVVIVVILLTELSMGLAACVVEDLPATRALGRARKLSKGTRGRIFVMFLVVWAIAIALSMIGYIPTMITIGILAATGHNSQSAAIATVVVQIINMLVNFIMQTLVAPVYLAALVMFYFDQRVRLEGYDIEWMMQKAGLDSTEFAIPPGSISPMPQVEPSPSPEQEQ
jgi:Protein of unknown function (DUF975).